MCIADTSFIIRSMEFREFDEVNSEKELEITSEIENELTSKDAETVEEDLGRIKALISKNSELENVEIIKSSAVKDEIERILDLLSGASYSIDKESEFRRLIDSFSLPEDLEKGELEGSIFCKEEDRKFFTDDFLAYEKLFAPLEGKISSLCEFITSDSNSNELRKQRIVSIIEKLFVPYEKMDVSIRIRIRKKVEKFLDREFKTLA